MNYFLFVFWKSRVCFSNFAIYVLCFMFYAIYGLCIMFYAIYGLCFMFYAIYVSCLASKAHKVYSLKQIRAYCGFTRILVLVTSETREPSPGTASLKIVGCQFPIITWPSTKKVSRSIRFPTTRYTVSLSIFQGGGETVPPKGEIRVPKGGEGDCTWRYQDNRL